MAYYMAGDYYMTSAGDPGLFSFVGKALGAVGGLLPGPLGSVAKFAGGLLNRPARQPAPLAIPFAGPRVQQRSLIGSIGSRLRTAGQAIIPGGVEPGAGCPPGYHLDKQTRSQCVKNRRMNPGNARALRRAIRREAAFVGLAKRTLRGSGYTFKRTGVARKRKR